MDVNEHRDLVSRYGIQQAPTLIVLHGGHVEKLVNASVIKNSPPSSEAPERGTKVPLFPPTGPVIHQGGCFHESVL